MKTGTDALLMDLYQFNMIQAYLDCGQNTPGAALHKNLHVPHTELILRKGFRHAINSYSAFYENDGITPPVSLVI
jgi:hypothetical protein